MREAEEQLHSFFNLSTRSEDNGKFYSTTLNPWGKVPLYPLNSMLGRTREPLLDVPKTGKKLIAPPWAIYHIKYPVLAATLYGAYSLPKNSIFICTFAWKAQLRKRRPHNESFKFSVIMILHSKYCFLQSSQSCWQEQQVYGAMVEWYWQGKSKYWEKKPVIVPLCFRWTRAAEVRDRQLTAWAKARHLKTKIYPEFVYRSSSYRAVNTLRLGYKN